MIDESNGYERIAELFIKSRGRAFHGIGSSTVRAWARTFKRGSTVLDLGCGTGIPVTNILLEEGLNVYAVDASPKMVEDFRQNFPAVPVACEPVERSAFFHRSFDGIIAWGLVFLIPGESQRALIPKMAAALNPGGRLSFTSPPVPVQWEDAMTGQVSRSLGGEIYRQLILSSGLIMIDEMEDEGENHYYNAEKPGS